MHETKKRCGRPPRNELDTTPSSTKSRRGRPRKRPVVTCSATRPTIQGGNGPIVVDIDKGVRARAHEEARHISPDLSQVVGRYDVNNVSLQYRLRDMAKKCQDLEERHQKLGEINVRKAERTYDSLRHETDEKIAEANQLIAQLRQQLTIELASAIQADQARQELEASRSKVEGLEKELESLNSSLTQARAEIKSLSEKLAAFHPVQSEMKCGSTSRADSSISRSAQAEAAHLAQHVAQAKEDLYGDLTGLILREVTQDDTENIFDCIQTGRNGTLHFKLIVEHPSQADGYNDVQFTYQPQLSPENDQVLMEMLPDYLLEEIAFQRPQASRFLARMFKCLMDRSE